jgi:hypothetical protein
MYLALVEAVNGTVPGPASTVTYDIRVVTDTGSYTMAGVAPAFRPAVVKADTLHVAGFEVGDRIAVAEVGAGDSRQLVILTPEPPATEEAS